MSGDSAEVGEAVCACVRACVRRVAGRKAEGSAASMGMRVCPWFRERFRAHSEVLRRSAHSASDTGIPSEHTLTHTT